MTEFGLTLIFRAEAGQIYEFGSMTPFIDEPARVIITDLLMPSKGGLEAIPELRRKYPEAIIIGISGQPDLLPAAESLGADRTLQKPFHAQELLGLIDDLLR